VYAISSKDINELSLATIHLITSATVVITDDKIALQELLHKFIDQFASQKNLQLSYAQSGKEDLVPIFF
jgi:hypothetical protein